MTVQQCKDSFTHVSRDDYKKETVVHTSANILAYEPSDQLSVKSFRLQAVKEDSSKKVSYRLTLKTCHARTAIYWKSVVDRNGRAFSLEGYAEYEKDHNIDTILVTEYYYAELSREYLESIQETGIHMRFYGVITRDAYMWPQVIQGFLMRADEEFKKY